uniref:MCM_N domain-containing protein n=1 Tax=Rhabditophanes sp. KR3021 TaxID=114890 RepID=A0AC35UIB1_9BILA
MAFPLGMRQLPHETTGKEPPIVEEGSLAVGRKDVPAKSESATTTNLFLWFKKVDESSLTEHEKLLGRSRPNVQAYVDEIEGQLSEDFVKAFVNKNEVLELRRQLMECICFNQV